jgi:hypothetical protein
MERERSEGRGLGVGESRGSASGVTYMIQKLRDVARLVRMFPLRGVDRVG